VAKKYISNRKPGGGNAVDSICSLAEKVRMWCADICAIVSNLLGDSLITHLRAYANGGFPQVNM